MVSFLVVAELFGKLHDNVLQSLNDLEIPDHFNALNFQDSSYINKQNKEQPSFNMTRDGFSPLAMESTGQKVMEAKLTIPPVEGKIQYKKSTPEAVKSFEGVARYWCFLEGINYDTGKANALKEASH